MCGKTEEVTRLGRSGRRNHLPSHFKVSFLPNCAVITGRCRIMGISRAVLVLKDQLSRYLLGEDALDVFTEMTADDREFIVSGISPEGWCLLTSKVSVDVVDDTEPHQTWHDGGDSLQ